jgi:hypothetical protein
MARAIDQPPDDFAARFRYLVANDVTAGAGRAT